MNLVDPKEQALDAITAEFMFAYLHLNTVLKYSMVNKFHSKEFNEKFSRTWKNFTELERYYRRAKQSKLP